MLVLILPRDFVHFLFLSFFFFCALSLDIILRFFVWVFEGRNCLATDNSVHAGGVYFDGLFYL